MDAEVTTKVCSKCGVKKLRTDFHKANSKKYGLSSQCKLCSAEYRRKYYSKNKEKFSEIEKRYYTKNREIIIERKKKYNTKNKEKIANYLKKYRTENKRRANELRKHRVACLYDSYIKDLIRESDQTFKQSPIPQSLINLKREEIKIKRLIKEMTQ